MDETLRSRSAASTTVTRERTPVSCDAESLQDLPVGSATRFRAVARISLRLEVRSEFGIAAVRELSQSQAAMSTRTLNCYSCGAAVTSDSPNCGHCGARLATISCPRCFGMMFQGAKFCPHCGGAAAQWQGAATEMPCPKCQSPLLRGELADLTLHECEQCFGVWIDTATFERICQSSEEQSAVLATAGPVDYSGSVPLERVRYVRCPECSDLMNRANFAKCSGVVVDVCRPHGTWFDKDEL